MGITACAVSKLWVPVKKGGGYHSFVLLASFEVPVEKPLAGVYAGEILDGFGTPSESRPTESRSAIGVTGMSSFPSKAGFKAGDS